MRSKKVKETKRNIYFVLDPLLKVGACGHKAWRMIVKNVLYGHQKGPEALAFSF